MRSSLLHHLDVVTHDLDDGWTSATAAGCYTAAINILAIPFAFVAPAIIERGYTKLLTPLASVGALITVGMLLTT